MVKFGGKKNAGLLWGSLLLCFLMWSSSCGPEKRPLEPQGGREPLISLYLTETGETKQIMLEEYLKGVVAAEMTPTWPQNALAAQAILARTFTLERIKEEGGVPARGTDASTAVEEFQAYDPTKINEAVREAVEQTRGEVVKHQGEYIKAWFFAEGGGLTAASAEEGLAYTKKPSPYIHSVSDPGVAITTEENKSWQVSFPLNKVRQSVQEVVGQDPGPLTKAVIVRRGPSGRVLTFKFNEVTLSAPALRLALGSEKMRSTLLTSFVIEGNNLVIKGKGFGHGVGLSQWGAKALAEQGKSAEEIIQYFFKDVEIVKEWE